MQARFDLPGVRWQGAGSPIVGPVAPFVHFPQMTPP